MIPDDQQRWEADLATVYGEIAGALARTHPPVLCTLDAIKRLAMQILIDDYIQNRTLSRTKRNRDAFLLAFLRTYQQIVTEVPQMEHTI